MATWTQTSSPFSRLSLIAKGSQSQSPSPRGRDPKRAPMDDDYIPYNGPYEEPPRRRQERNRDSWGDPLYGDEDSNNMIQELHQRYVPNDQSNDPWHEENEDRKGRPRARTHSGISGRTVSSGTVDPHRASVSVLRKASHHGTASRPPVPSYINLDAAGGVGATPVPPPRLSREAAPPKRSSLASIFAFGQTSKKAPLSPAKVAHPTSPVATSPLAKTKYGRGIQAPPQRPTSNPPSLYSVSSDLHHPDLYPPNNKAESISTSHATDEGAEVFHSYYNYTPVADQFGQLRNPTSASSLSHPYAYVFPSDILAPPQTAPLVTSPKLKFTVPQPNRLALAQQDAPAAAPRVRSLQNYASVPDLRSSSRSPNRLRKPQPATPKGKDRWLSAETWCDAVLFPRPRLKIEDAQLLLSGASGRIVSPPGSPVMGGFAAQQSADRPQGMVSRVLAHSRSLASLNAEAGPSRLRNEVAKADVSPPSVPPPPILLPTQIERPPRPKSFAWDDLALPSPVPSLARVLEEGQILEHQRKKWQTQATGSFQNTRARSLSRARSKSMTQRGKTGQSSIDFLAARSLLGNQDVVPVLPARYHTRTNSQSGTTTNGTTTFTRTSHSHSNSLAKTLSKSSQSQSHGHSRQDSWSRSAFKKAVALCYVDGVLSPADAKFNGLETALREGGTKVIRLADPALMSVDMGGPHGALSPRTDASPTPSAMSDTRMGIAISTPPPNDNSSVEPESIHLPSHPYAQGGMYSYHNTAAPAVAERSKGADYAGPHPTSQAMAIVNPDLQDVSTRHRLPPQASLTYHPYAAPSSGRNSYQLQPRADSDVPPASKMWAQLSPGVVREVLPCEILYSPFMSECSTTPDDGKEPEGYGRNRKSTVTILDTVGVGETLASAVEEENSRDSGVGTSEEHAAMTVEEWTDDRQEGQAAAIQAHHPYRIHRKPVQYDVSRPLYTPKKLGVDSNTIHTVGSSPVDPSVNHGHRLMPPTPPPLLHSSSGSSGAQGSAASSPPRSPPPIGSVDDLDEFRDLFYKPNLTEEALNSLNRPTSTRQPSITWDLGSHRTRTGSGLTSLARQLSQEFEELRAVRERARSHSLESESSISRFSGLPMESDIQFVLSESLMSRATDSPEPDEQPAEDMLAFQASSHLPEDVESSCASSVMDRASGDEDEHASFRLGNVESVSTPLATATDHRISLIGQMAFVNGPTPKAAPPRTLAATLQPHSADPTRSSYMTESTLSRISNLSDFPAPPPQRMTPAHMSLLSSYFHESIPAEHAIPDDQSTLNLSLRPKEVESRSWVGERF
ncbi:hypothetical protein B0H10DRAFT_2209286 [Mycena sp. CBHHK59/15]|nr:hypothetical protein B0H10DRAFT_2209286 [Mycena sp. CBHHK59/15]